MLGIRVKCTVSQIDELRDGRKALKALISKDVPTTPRGAPHCVSGWFYLD